MSTTSEAMPDENIKQLSNVLSDYLGTNKVIIDKKISRLTAPGENYGSIMLKLDITVRNADRGLEENLFAVAKLIPPSDKVQEIFNTQVTYKNEIAFYEVIVPTLVNFQRVHGITDVIDCFAKLYGARINLDRSDKVDADAVLIIENLKESGFANINRLDGFDLPTTKLILLDLAKLHAVPLALKLHNPEQFEKYIKAYCLDYSPIEEQSKDMQKIMKRILEENELCAPLVSRLAYWGEKEKSKKPREPFATLTHADLWVNNTMQKFENELPVRNKFVDFQIFTYGSPASDLFFFLWSSVNQKVLIENLDSLIKYYHDNFIQTLQELKCDTDLFNYDKFLEELDIAADFEFAHAITFLTFVVQSRRRSAFDGTFDEAAKEKFYKSVPEETKELVWNMVQECAKRGWFK